MRYARSFIATVAIAATLVMCVRLGTEPVAAKKPLDPCKQPIPVCGSNSIAQCAKRALCGCVKWTCVDLYYRAKRPPVPPEFNMQTKQPLKPKSVPGPRLK
jgi:hypothetical protein